MKSWPSPVKSSGQGHRLLDVLGRERAGAGGDVADERDVADRAAVHDRAGVGLVADLDRAGLGGVAPEVALVLQRTEVRVHRGARGEADGLADLADAGRVPAAADLDVDELEDLLLAGGERGCFGHASAKVTRSGVRGKHLFGDFP